VVCVHTHGAIAVAYLRVDKGSCPGQILELTGARMVVGRHPSCEIVLDNAAVSRRHAQILESHGNYFIEDLRSRNRTYLNGTAVDGRISLKDADTIIVCDVELSFHLHMAPDSDSPTVTVAGSSSADSAPSKAAQQATSGGDGRNLVFDDDSHDSLDSSSIVSTLSAKGSSSLRLSVKPEAKLRAVLEIGRSLGNSLRLDDVLQKTLDGLFKIFPQADNGFVLLKDPERNRLLVKAAKSRQGGEEPSVRISMTVVRQAMKTGEAILSANALGDERFKSSESLSDLQIRSMMCVPLIGHDDDPLGVIQIDTRDLPQRFAPDDLDMLVSVSSQVSLAVANATLHEELQQQRDQERDLKFATQVQLGFLPNKRPQLPGYQFADYYEAAQQVGGDYFDYVTLSDGRVAVALGDVAGKGVPAALLSARLYSSARFHLLTKPTVGEALTGLNSELVSSGLGYRFITFVVMIIDAKSNTVTIANAGHWPPLLRHCGGDISDIATQTSGAPLGVLPDQSFGETTIPLRPGEVLLLFTDGITEAMNPADDIYGAKRLRRILSSGPDSAQELVQDIVTDVESFCSGRAQRDDMCLVCVRRSQ